MHGGVDPLARPPRDAGRGEAGRRSHWQRGALELAAAERRSARTRAALMDGERGGKQVRMPFAAAAAPRHATRSGTVSHAVQFVCITDTVAVARLQRYNTNIPLGFA